MKVFDKVTRKFVDEVTKEEVEDRTYDDVCDPIPGANGHIVAAVDDRTSTQVLVSLITGKVVYSAHPDIRYIYYDPLSQEYFCFMFGDVPTYIDTNERIEVESVQDILDVLNDNLIKE